MSMIASQMAGTSAYPSLQLGWTMFTAWAGLLLLLVSVIYLRVGIWRPYKLHKFYRRQNVKGPAYRPFVGNLIDISNLQRTFARIKRQPANAADVAVRSFPHLSHWSKLYGSVFTYMEGAKVNLCVLDADLIGEVLVSKADCYRRSPAGWFWSNLHPGGALADQSKITELMSHNECAPHRWSTLRRILGPGTDRDSHTAQGNLQNVIDQCKRLLVNWERLLDEASAVVGGWMDVDAAHEIAKTSMDIVLTNLIGSTISRSDLEMIDSILDTKKEELEKATAYGDVFSGHFGTSKLSKDVWLNQLLTQTVQSRFRTLDLTLEQQATHAPKDLVDLMVSSSYRSAAHENVQQVVADCKMVVAAQNSTTALINNTLLLLARHTEWQVQARAEVLDIRPFGHAFERGGGGLYHCNSGRVYAKLAKLKILNMILNESLRLSPPIISVNKLCHRRHRLGKYAILPGTFVQLPIVLLHHSCELWGEDSASFRPDRFEHFARQHKPFALLPFSAGPSVCLGLSLALQEAKIVLAAILSTFSLHLSLDSSVDGASSIPNLNPSGSLTLSIRRLLVDDFAKAAKERLSRTQSNFF